MKVTVILDVDKETLKEVRKQAGFRGESLDEQISQELGWVEASGISVDSIEIIKPLTKMQIIGKHFDAYLAGSDDISYTKIHAALKKALKENPDGMADHVKVLHKGERVTIDLIEDMQYTTVKRFCELCGITI